MLLFEHESGRHHHLSSDILARIQNLHIDAREISSSSLPHLKTQDPEYYLKLQPLVEQPMSVFKDYRRVNLKFQWDPGVLKKDSKYSIFYHRTINYN